MPHVAQLGGALRNSCEHVEHVYTHTHANNALESKEKNPHLSVKIPERGKANTSVQGEKSSRIGQD